MLVLGLLPRSPFPARHRLFISLARARFPWAQFTQSTLRTVADPSVSSTFSALCGLDFAQNSSATPARFTCTPSNRLSSRKQLQPPSCSFTATKHLRLPLSSVTLFAYHLLDCYAQVRASHKILTKGCYTFGS